MPAELAGVGRPLVFPVVFGDVSDMGALGVRADDPRRVQVLDQIVQAGRVVGKVPFKLKEGVP